MAGRNIAGLRAMEIDHAIKDEKHRASAIKAKDNKPKITKPTKVITSWFLLRGSTNTGFTSICKGSKTECMKHLVEYRRKNPSNPVEVYLVNGLMIIGY